MNAYCNYKIIFISYTIYKFNVTADDIEYGQNATVRVSLETSATGNVTIYVNDEINKNLKNSKTIDNKLYVDLMKKYGF